MNAVHPAELGDFTDRLEIVEGQTLTEFNRFQIVWRNTERRDLYLLNFHPMVPRETAELVLRAMKKSPDLLRKLK
jgi:hypothetical protein